MGASTVSFVYTALHGTGGRASSGPKHVKKVDFSNGRDLYERMRTSGNSVYDPPVQYGGGLPAARTSYPVSSSWAMMEGIGLTALTVALALIPFAEEADAVVGPAAAGEFAAAGEATTDGAVAGDGALGAANTAIKAGSQGGETAGKAFSESVRREALEENPDTCVYCQMKTEQPQVDHVIPKSRGGSATIDNAQTTCAWCNGSKGPRDFPVNAPPGYEGDWPPSWWKIPE